MSDTWLQNNSTPECPQYPELELKYNIPSQEYCEISVTPQYKESRTVDLAPGMAAKSSTTYYGRTILPIKDYEGYFPISNAKQSTIQYYKGIAIHYFTISPVQYDVRNKKLEITSRFKVVITFKKGIEDLEEERSLFFKSQRSQELVSRCELIDWTPNESYDTYPSECTKDLLLVVNSVCATQGKNYIQKYVDWKKKLGFRVHVIDDKESWTAEELKTIITNKYYELDNLSYVLFMGWFSQMPGLQFTPYLTAHPGSIPSTNTTKSYIAYSLINGYNDFTPKFAVGRIHPLNVAQCDTIINKIIEYESNPVLDPFFYSNAFLVGQFEPVGADENATNSSNLVQEELGFIQWLERTRPILTENGINAKRIYKRHYTMENAGVYPLRWSPYSIYNIDTFRPRPNGFTFTYPTQTEDSIPTYLRYPNFKWDGKISDIQESLSKGAFLGIYYGHGNNYGWHNFSKFYAEQYIAAQSGPKPSLIFGISCLTGDNNWECAFANVLSRSEHGPIGMYASADYSYIKPNQFLLYGLVHALWPNYSAPGGYSYFQNRTMSYRLGDILNNGMDFCLDNTIDVRMKMHQRLTYTCFGDPSIDLYTEVPTIFEQPHLENFGPLVSIDLEQQPKHEYPVFINFYEEENNRVESYEYDGKDYYFEASENVDSVLVSITSHNKIPYFKYVKVNRNDWSDPRPFGKINDVAIDAANGEVKVYCSINPNVNNIRYRMVAVNENLANPNIVPPVEDYLDPQDQFFGITIPHEFHGYLMVYLIHENTLLDSRKILVEYN